MVAVAATDNECYAHPIVYLLYTCGYAREVCCRASLVNVEYYRVHSL